MTATASVKANGLDAFTIQHFQSDALGSIGVLVSAVLGVALRCQLS
jgi:Co/Zn/Cd efflux system component